MIDTLRHYKVFDPNRFSGRVDIIGVGAGGSRVAMSLAKLGVTDIHVWDYDVVESHNIGNQLYGNCDINKYKVDALYERILADTGTKITIHNEKVEASKLESGEQMFGDVVFLLVDTMKCRKEIYDSGIKMKINIKLMVECRMGADNGRVYAVNPLLPNNCEAWEASLYDDSETEESLCGSTISVGPTADVIAGAAVWQFIQWFKDGELTFETLFGVNPLTVYVSRVI